jgi:hypothetical protein
MRGGASHEEAHPFEKEREEKDDGRYIIFYTFEDDETGKVRPDEEGNG